MAKGQKRSSREAKKPKKVKGKETAAGTPGVRGLVEPIKGK